MIAAATPSQETLFQAQYRYMVQACMQYHAFHAKQSLESVAADPTRSCPNQDLTMVNRVGAESCLTNPHFRIEGCLDSL